MIASCNGIREGLGRGEKDMSFTFGKKSLSVMHIQYDKKLQMSLDIRPLHMVVAL